MAEMEGGSEHSGQGRSKITQYSLLIYPRLVPYSMFTIGSYTPLAHSRAYREASLCENLSAKLDKHRGLKSHYNPP